MCFEAKQSIALFVYNISTSKSYAQALVALLHSATLASAALVH